MTVQHHEDSLAAYVRRVRQDPDVLGVVLGGSVAHGTERADSDVDLFLLLTEDAFAEHARQNRFSYVDREQITYAGGYFDIKVISLDYLAQAADHGDDPTRSSLARARVAWSRIDDLDARVAAVADLPAEVWEQRIGSFIAQVRLHGGYFVNQASKLDNSYLLHHAAVHLVGAGGRALLALNRTFFPGHKYLEPTLAALDRIPVGYQDTARAALSRPGVETATVYRDLLEAFHPWPLTQQSTLSTFVRDNELSWLTGTAPPEYS